VIAREVGLVLAAALFLPRLPLGRWARYSDEQLKLKVGKAGGK